MFQKIKNFLFYAGTDREKFYKIKKNIYEANRRTVLVFSLFGLICTVIMFFLSFFQKEAAVNRNVYALGVVGSLFLFVMGFLFGKKYPKIITFLMYIAASIFFIYGIILGCFTRPQQQTCTFMVLLIFIPLIFVDSPIRMSSCVALYDLAYMIIASQTKPAVIRTMDLTNAFIFGLLALISSASIMSMKVRGYVLDMELHKISERDELTGLKNRNCYEWNLESYMSKCDNTLGCIYFDANGLHSLNNTEGHKAGDKMLITLAREIEKLFGTDDAYRIGGDEFIVLLRDPSVTMIAQKIAYIQKEVESQGYTASAGYATIPVHKGDINLLIEKAEKNMYADKTRYYKENDVEERI